MRFRYLAGTAALALAAAAFLAAPVPATAAPAGPRILLGELFCSQNQGDSEWMHAHALTYIMTVASLCQEMWTQDAQRWGSNQDGTVTTVQIAVGNNRGDCATWSSNTGIYTQACEAGFGNGDQQWYFKNAGGGVEWIINADASAHTPSPPHNYIYMTRNSLNQLVGDGPGFGLDAEWLNICENC
jgi:hypothetical protein